MRIYEHALEEGWVKPGDYLVDIFAGVGGFALEAMRHGLNFVGCELEQRFCDMGQGCDCTGIGKEDWVRFQGRWDKMRYEGGRHWCPECLMKAGAVTGEREFKALPLPGTEWAIVAKMNQSSVFTAAPSSSYARNSGKIPCTGPHHYRGNIETWEQQGMAGTAVIVQGDSRRLGEVLERARICVSSPPFQGVQGTGSGDLEAHRGRTDTTGEYGNTPGQLAHLPDTGFEAALAVSSPVYAGGCAHTGGDDLNPEHVEGGEVHHVDYGREPGQLAQMPLGDLALALGSPPYIGTAIEKSSAGVDLQKQYDTYRAQGGGASFQAFCETQRKHSQGYGTADGQLAALPEGDHAEACERPAIAISSPPFLAQSGGINVTAKGGPLADASLLKRHSAGNKATAAYGTADGQLAALPEGDHAAALEAGAGTGRARACISSPPWENQIPSQADAEWHQARDSIGLNNSLGTGDYGNTAGQLGQETGSTFWAASRTILEQVYQVLAPGGHAIFVCKRFVRNKQIVEFPTQWARLCEAVGFKWIHHHKAWLVEDRGAQHTLEGGLEKRQVKRMSFFRRLHSQKYPHLEILWEDVLCFVKEAK